MNDGSDSSNPSIATEFSASELLENTKNLKSPQKMSSVDRSKLKKQMLMKKLALSDDCAPKLAKPDSYIDIGAKEDEERELEWLKGRFPPSHPSTTVKKSTTSCVVQRKEQKNEIMQKLSRQRRQAQERRKQLYAQDNEELFEEEETEDEDEEEVESEGEEEEEDEDNRIVVMEKDENSGNLDLDENRIADDDSNLMHDENIDDDEVESNADCNEEKGEEHSGKLISENKPSGNTPVPLPDSLSQWFNRSEDRLHESATVNKEFEEFIQMNDLVAKGAHSQSDLLNLCSGNFASQDSDASVAEEEKGDEKEEEEEEEVLFARKRKGIVSDNEEDEEGEEMDDGRGTIADGEKGDGEEEKQEEQSKAFNRVVMDSDDDEEDNEELEDEADDNEQVDSDDEMAVFRRQEKQREARRDWVEEEAELSGDDVGSDVEEESDLLDHYEAEEGDLDTVPDEEQLRMELHKQLMKQQESSDHRELIQLRERLLGDDFTGMETNRTFRLKLREDEDELGGDDDEDKKEEEEEAEDDVNIEAIKRRMEMEEREVDGEEEKEKEKETRHLDVFSSISCATSLTNRHGGRVRASLLHMDSFKMLGKENMNVKEKRNTFFISKESKDNENDQDSVSDSLSVKRKNTVENETIAKKSKPSPLPNSSLFSKFN